MSNELMKLSKEELDLMKSDANEYVEDESEKVEMVPPTLKFVRGQTDLLNKKSDVYVEGLDEGDLYNSLADKVYKITDPAQPHYVVQIAKKIDYSLKQPDGMKVITSFGSDPTEYNKAQTDRSGKRVDADGNIFSRAYKILVQLFDKDLHSEGYFILWLSGESGIMTMKNWYTLSRTLKMPDGSVSPNGLPPYAGLYQILSEQKANKSGKTYMVLKFLFKDYVINALGIDTYKEVQQSYNSMSSVLGAKVETSENEFVTEKI